MRIQIAQTHTTTMQSFALLAFVASASAANVLAPQDILELSASPAPSPEAVPDVNRRFTAYEMELRVKNAVADAKKEAYAKVAADKASAIEVAKENIAKRTALNMKRQKDISVKIAGLQARAAQLKIEFQDIEDAAKKKEYGLTDAIVKQTDVNDKGKLSSSNAIIGTQKQAEFEEKRLADLLVTTKDDLVKAKDIAAYGFSEAKKAIAAQNAGFKEEKRKANESVNAILTAAKGREQLLESQIAKKKTELSYGKQEAVEASKKAKDTRTELDAQILLKIKAQEEAVVAAAMATEKYALKIADQKAKISMVTQQINSKSKELVEGKQFAVQWNCVQKDLSAPTPAPAPGAEPSPSPSPAA